MSVATRASNLKAVTYRGEGRGTNAAAVFRTATQPRIRALYPANLWPLTTEEVKNVAEDRVEWTLTFTELATPLPAAPAGAEIFDGDLVRATELDEHYGKVQTLSIDFAFSGDPIAIKDLVRPAGTILRERWDYNTHQDRRVKASFSMLSSTEETTCWSGTTRSRRRRKGRTGRCSNTSARCRGSV